MELARGAVKEALKALLNEKEKEEKDKAEGIKVKLEEQRENRITERIGPRTSDQGVSKEPKGAPPTTVTRDFTPFQAKNWAEEMQMYGAKCQNIFV